MALKGPKVRARVGEQPTRGEVRPVTNRTLINTSLILVVLVVLATVGILWASAGTKTPTTVTTNTPSLVPSSATTSYQEVAELPALLGSTSAKSEPAKRQTATASVSLQCSSSCTGGNYTGFGGTFALSVSGSQLTGSLHSTCQDDSLVLVAPAAIAAPAKLPQTLTGTLTRTSTCPGTSVASPVTLTLNTR